MTCKQSALLSRLSGVAGAKLPEVDTLGARLLKRRFAARDVLMRQGAVDANIRCVASGIVKLVYADPEGREFTKSILEEGDLFASLAALRGEPASFSAVAISDGEVEALPWRLIDEMTERCHTWQTVARRCFQSFAQRKERREFELLTLSAAERWRRLGIERPGLVARLSQQELAALIGITPVALSRLRARLLRRP